MMSDVAVNSPLARKKPDDEWCWCEGIPCSIQARVHSDAHNARPRQGGEVGVLELLSYGPRDQITLHSIQQI